MASALALQTAPPEVFAAAANTAPLLRTAKPAHVTRKRNVERLRIWVGMPMRSIWRLTFAYSSAPDQRSVHAMRAAAAGLGGRARPENDRMNRETEKRMKRSRLVQCIQDDFAKDRAVHGVRLRVLLLLCCWRYFSPDFPRGNCPDQGRYKEGEGYGFRSNWMS